MYAQCRPRLGDVAGMDAPMLFQDVVEPQPKTPVPGHEDFEPSIV